MSDGDSTAAQAIKAAVLESFSADFIGFALATALYGATILQTYLYFRGYPGDKVGIKILVLYLWCMDTFATVLMAHAIWTNQITNFGTVVASTKVPWSFRLENGVIVLITYSVQLYFAKRLWSLSKKKWLTAGILLLASASFALGLEQTVEMLKHTNATDLIFKKQLAISGLTQGLAALCDIVITVGLCYYIQVPRSGMRKTTFDFDIFILYAINRGILTALVQTLSFAANVAFPTRHIWLPFHQAVGKLYVNSFLATLNGRPGPTSISWSASRISDLTNPIKFKAGRTTVRTDALKSSDLSNTSAPQELEINVTRSQIRTDDFSTKHDPFKASYETDDV